MRRVRFSRRDFTAVARHRRFPVRAVRLIPADAESTAFYELEMLLVGDLLAHLDSRGGQAAPVVAAAERRWNEYGIEAARLGASLVDTVEIFLRFRKTFVKELALVSRRRSLCTRQATSLLGDAQSALDRMLVALMIGHHGSRNSW